MNAGSPCGDVGKPNNFALPCSRKSRATTIRTTLRACPQLEDSQVDYRVIHRRSADSGPDGCAATPFRPINGTGSAMVCPAAKRIFAAPPRTTLYLSLRFRVL